MKRFCSMLLIVMLLTTMQITYPWAEITSYGRDVVYELEEVLAEVLDSINNAATIEEITQILNNNRDILGIDMTDYNALNAAGRARVADSLRGRNFNTVEQFVNIFRTAIENAKNNSSSGGTSSGGGGGSSSGNVIEVGNLTESDPADFVVVGGVLTSYIGVDSYAVIPASLGITEIGAGAFTSNNNVTIVAIPEGVTVVNDAAFLDCPYLSYVILPSTLLTIGNLAFKDCVMLNRIFLPRGLTSIGVEAFANTAFTRVTIWENVTAIGSGAFPSGGAFTVYGMTGSYASTYAAGNGNMFEAIVPGVDIPDFVLKQILIDQYDTNYDGELSNIEMLEITYLNLYGRGISSIVGLEYALNLENIYLYQNNLTDITPLKDLPKLYYADVGDNCIRFDTDSVQMETFSYLRSRGCNIYAYGQRELQNVVAPYLEYEKDITIPQGTVNAQISVSWREFHNYTNGLVFEWYKNTENSNTGGELILDPFWNYITIDTDVLGVNYYYLTVTIENSSFPSIKMASVTTEPIKVTVVPSWSSSKADNFAGGDGTELDPYQIETPEQLAILGNLNDGGTPEVDGKYFILNNDIDLGAKPWIPVEFKGYFEGNHKVIRNMRVIGDYSEQNNRPTGLFSYVNNNGNGSVVKNLGLEDIWITGGSESGGLTAYLDYGCVIENGYTTGRIGSGYGRGGLVGRNYGTVRNCYSTVDTVVNGVGTGDDKNGSCSGGLIGHHNGGVLENSYALGSVGPNSGGLISNCGPNGTVINSYYNEIYRLEWANDLGESKSDGELKEQNTYSGWDFNDVWAIDSFLNNGYPYLIGFTPEATQPTTFIVTFRYNDGAVIGSSEEVFEGGSVTPPTPPTIEGHTFAGWFTEQTGGEQVTDFTNIQADLTVYAVYSINTFTVRFYDSKGGQLLIEETVAYNGSVRAPAAPAIEGSAFTGWFADSSGNKVTSFNNIKSNIDVYAGYEAVSYSVTFRYGAGNANEKIENVPHGTAVTPPDAGIENMIMEGWYTSTTGGTRYTDFDYITGNLTLYARYSQGTVINDKNGPNRTMEGKVKYRDTSNWAEGVWVKAIERDGQPYNAATVTDANGQFALSLPYGSTYKVEVSSNNAMYAKTIETFTVNSSGGNNLGVYFLESKVDKSVLTVNVLQGGTGVQNAFISILNTAYSINLSKNTISGGSAAFSNVPYDKDAGSVYVVTCVYGSFVETKEVSVKGAQTVTFNLPEVYAVQGRATLGATGAQGVRVEAFNGGNLAGWAITDNSGNYSISSLPVGNYELRIAKTSKYFADAKTINVNKDIQNVNFELSTALSVKGSVYIDNSIASHAGVSLYKGNVLLAQSEATVGNGFFLSGAIVETGNDYYLTVDYARGSDGKNIDFEPVQAAFTVASLPQSTEEVLTKDIRVTKKVSSDLAFQGGGNLVTTDVDVVLAGMKMNAIVKFKNNSTGNVNNVKFTVKLPNDMTPNGDLMYTFESISAGASGNFSVPITVNNPISAFLTISVDIEYNSVSKLFGTASVDVAGITLNAPSTVNTDTSFTFYGEATKDSIVTIKNAETGETIAVTTPNGRWYSVKINNGLPQGGYTFIAEAVRGSNVVLSKEVIISSVENPPSISEVIIDGSKQNINKYSGTPTYSVWTDSLGDGRAFTLETSYVYGANIRSVKYLFLDKEYAADPSAGGYWRSTINNWTGKGTKTIKAIVTLANGNIYTFTVAEATILIDPSGYVYDKESDVLLEGITVICEVLNEDTGEWEFWDAEAHGQINPMITNDVGYYGWMVPEGTYRVIAQSQNHAPYITTDDEDENIRVIVIPPVRTDVNIALTPNVATLSVMLNESNVSITKGGTKQLIATVLPADATNKNNVKFISSDESIATVSSTGLITAKAVGECEITASIGVMTAKCTVNVKAGGGGTGGGGGGGGSPVIKPVTVSGLTDESQELIRTDEMLFNDMGSVPWAEEAINTLFDMGIINGKGNGVFAPNDNVTREEFIKMLLGVMGVSLVEKAPSFSDTISGEWYTPYIATAVESGIINGMEDGSFGVGVSITRQDIATMIFRAYNSKGLNSSQGGTDFADASDIEEYAREAVAALSAARIINGYEDGSFGPNNSATRAEAAVMLHRILLMLQ